MMRSGIFLSDLGASLARAAIGFVIGAVLGVIVGLLTARVRAVQFILGPFLTVLRPIPAIALVPIAIVWFGIGEPSKYFVIAYTVFLAVCSTRITAWNACRERSSSLRARSARRACASFSK